MTIDEKLKRATDIKESLTRLKGILDLFRKSRGRADKKNGIENDSYPLLLNFTASICTGRDNVTYGDTYRSGITDRDLLNSITITLEPLLDTEVKALETELESLFH